MRMLDTITPTTVGEIWMELKDRTLLAALMKERGVSARQLARKAGWRSHSYMNRLLRGQVKTLNVEPAARIAHALSVPFDVLFVTRVDERSAQTVRQIPA